VTDRIDESVLWRLTKQSIGSDVHSLPLPKQITYVSLEPGCVFSGASDVAMPAIHGG